jgi:hypothetical protein
LAIDIGSIAKLLVSDYQIPAGLAQSWTSVTLAV